MSLSMTPHSFLTFDEAEVRIQTAKCSSSISVHCLSFQNSKFLNFSVPSVFQAIFFSLISIPSIENVSLNKLLAMRPQGMAASSSSKLVA